MGPDGTGPDLDHYWVELATMLEAAKFDGLVIADVLGVYDTYQGSHDASVRRAMPIPVGAWARAAGTGAASDRAAASKTKRDMVVLLGCR